MSEYGLKVVESHYEWQFDMQINLFSFIELLLAHLFSFILILTQFSFVKDGFYNISVDCYCWQRRRRTMVINTFISSSHQVVRNIILLAITSRARGWLAEDCAIKFSSDSLMVFKR